MSEDHAQQLYALALSLVPDQEVAADLVWRSRNEADLRRRALAWRRQQGLPDPTGDEPLPALAPDDAALAEHLFRRGMRRRRGRAVGMALAACLVALGAVGGWRFSAAAVPAGLAADPVFAGEALTWTSPARDLQLVVYQAQAYPGAVTVWWELLGPGASQAAESVMQGLRLRIGDGVAPAESEVSAHRENRVLGRSLFPYLNAPRRLDLVLEAIDDQRVDWSLELQLDRLPADPGAVTYELGQQLEIFDEQVRIETVRVGKYATTVLFSRSQVPSALPAAQVTVDGDNLRQQGTWLPSTRPNGEYEAVLEPVPEGARELNIRYRLDQVDSQQYIFPLPAPEVFQEFRREGDKLVVALKPSFETPREVWVRVRDNEGHEFADAAVKELVGDDTVLKAEVPLAWRNVRVRTYVGGEPRIQTTDIVAGELKELVVAVIYPVPDPQVTVDLTAGR